jgi:predicted Fe-S protein YdhL (DUF1289 family)
VSLPVQDENSDYVPSPCVSVCVLDTSGRICIGCLRTLDEIAAWATLDATAKRRIVAELPARKASRPSSE